MSDGWRRNIDALRAEFETRLAALEQTAAEFDVVRPIERLAEELCGAAAREAEEAAARAQSDQAALLRRIETFQAQMQLTARTAQAEVLALRAELTAAQQDASAAQAEAQEMAARVRATEQQLQALEAAHVRARQALAASEARLVSEARERSALAVSLDAAHQATQAARVDADASQAKLSALLTAAQHDASAARQEVQEQTVRLKATEQRLEAIEAAHTRARQALAAREAQFAAEACDRAAPLARLRRSLQAFAGLTDERDVLATFITELERAFERVALFVVHENRLEGSQSVGFEPTTDVSNLIVPFTVDSPLTRAASQRTPIIVDSKTDEPTPGLLGHDSFGAIAIPIIIKQRLVAVAYGEMGRRLQADRRLIELQVAEILAEQLMQSLTHMGPPSATSAVVPNADAPAEDEGVARPANGPASTMSSAYPGPARAVDRVRMPDTVEVVVDGVTAQLIDLSSLGAQVTSAKMIRPNQQVRMMLPKAGQNTLCCGHVVWALFEMAPGGSRYRAGLKFTNVDTDAVEAFMSQQLPDKQRTSA